jgi:hypothetical protein
MLKYIFCSTNTSITYSNIHYWNTIIKDMKNFMSYKLKMYIAIFSVLQHLLSRCALLPLYIVPASHVILPAMPAIWLIWMHGKQAYARLLLVFNINWFAWCHSLYLFKRTLSHWLLITHSLSNFEGDFMLKTVLCTCKFTIDKVLHLGLVHQKDACYGVCGRISSHDYMHNSRANTIRQIALPCPLCQGFHHSWCSERWVQPDLQHGLTTQSISAPADFVRPFLSEMTGNFQT